MLYDIRYLMPENGCKEGKTKPSRGALPQKKACDLCDWQIQEVFIGSLRCGEGSKSQFKQNS